MKIGDKYKFTPAGFVGEKAEGLFPRVVVGTVDYINYRHGWVDLVFKVNGYTLHEGFILQPKSEHARHPKNKIVLPVRWEEIFKEYEDCHITAAEAIKLSGLTKSTFYARVNATRAKLKF